jgi:hypothetical protein
MTARKAWASRARIVQRCQEVQWRTWCWSSPARLIPVWKHSSMVHRRPATRTSLGGRPGGECIGAYLAGCGRYLVVTGDGHDMADATSGQFDAQVRVIAVHLVADHPRCRRASVQRAGDHCPCQRGLGCELHRLGNSGGPAPIGVIDPNSGQIQLPVDERVSVPGRVSQIHHYLAVFDSSRGTGVLALHTNRCGTLLRSPVSLTTSTASASARWSSTYSRRSSRRPHPGRQRHRGAQEHSRNRDGLSLGDRSGHPWRGIRRGQSLQRTHR